MIKKYVKKPIPVEAVQWRGSDYTKDQIDWIFQNANVRFAEKDPATLIIRTLEGDMKACPGDYIVRGVDGEYYPVKKEIFEKTYREVKQPDSNAICFKDDLNCEKEWIKQEKELEKDEWVCVRKDRLEDLIQSSYKAADMDIESCPLDLTSICKWKRGLKTACSDCKFEYDHFRDDFNPPVKNVVEWLEGEGDI